MKYDREKMREALYATFTANIVSLAIPIIEQTLGLHTPAPVGGEKRKCFCPENTLPDHYTFCPFYDKPQKKQCAIDCAPDDSGHRQHCPLYQQLLKEKMELPESINGENWSISELIEGHNRLLAHLRAQQN